MTKTLLFDLDGTLVTIGPALHFRALNDALTMRGYSSISIYDHETKYNGLPTLTKLEMIGLPEEEAVSINYLKQRLTLEAIEERLKPDNELVELIRRLKVAGFKMACVTNCSKDSAYLMLKKAGLFEFMDLIISNQDVQKPKPDPEGYLKAAILLGAVPLECIIFEDSRKGFEAAWAADISLCRVHDRQTLVDFLRVLLK